MTNETILTGVLLEETNTYTVVQICHKYHIPQELLAEMIEQGLFSVPSADIEHLTLDQKSVQRIEKAFRLHRDLDINLPGVALALDLLDEIDKIHQELDILRKSM